MQPFEKEGIQIWIPEENRKTPGSIPGRTMPNRKDE